MSAEKKQTVQIAAPKLRTAEFKLIGNSPFVQLRFSQKAMNTMMDKMKGGSQSKGKKVQEDPETIPVVVPNKVPVIPSPSYILTVYVPAE